MLVLSLLVGIPALADSNAAVKAPCLQIKKACENVGFAKKQAKEGKGLWVDCVNPIMQGKAQPSKAVIKLPTVDASLISACKAKRPNFGQGHGKMKKHS